jgi:hypothetical protein
VSYARTTLVRRRPPHRLAGANPVPSLGFDWGSGWGKLFTNIGTSAAQGVAQAGVQRLTTAIAGGGGGGGAVAAPAPAQQPPVNFSSGLGNIPMWGWVAGGFGLILLVVLVSRR